MKPITIEAKASNGMPTARDVKFLHEGREIGGIQHLSLNVGPGDLIEAELQLFIREISIDATAVFQVIDPATGSLRAVKRIEYADGGITEL